MRTAEDPFPMETTYSWTAIDDNTTKMTLRNKGNPSGFSKLVAPLMATMMRKANKKDLLNIKKIIETYPCQIFFTYYLIFTDSDNCFKRSFAPEEATPSFRTAVNNSSRSSECISFFPVPRFTNTNLVHISALR